MGRPVDKISSRDAVRWLLELSRYFENRPTGGEDMAYWSNVENSATAKKIAGLLEAQNDR